MDTTVVEQLSIDKAQLRQVAQARLGILGSIALLHGRETKNGSIEYRLTKTQLDKVEGHGITIRPLKGGGLAVTVRKADPAS